VTKLALEPGGPLATLFEGAGLTLVDVGARGEPRGEMRALAPYANLVAFEPDGAEADRLASELAKGAWRGVTVVPKALGGETGPRELVLTAQAGLSSLLRPDRAVVDRYWFGEAFAVVGAEQVETVTLDAAAEAYGFEDACFLKLDTQGTELEILRSGERLLEESVQGIYVETNFQPLYERQGLFADVDAVLRARGFVLLDLRKTLQRGREHRPDEYSRRQVTWAHCLYVRDLDRLEGLGQAGYLARWLCVVLAYEHHDLARALFARPALADALAGRYGGELAADLDRFVEAATRRRLRKLDGDAGALLGTTARA
jgi:FkbM family methyltransferase